MSWSCIRREIQILFILYCACEPPPHNHHFDKQIWICVAHCSHYRDIRIIANAILFVCGHIKSLADSFFKMPDLTYLGAIIPCTYAVYGLFVSALLFFFFRQERRRQEAEALVNHNNASKNSPSPSLLELYFSPLPFNYTYKSVNVYGGDVLLLCTRTASFCYIFGLSGLWNFIREDWTNLYFFTLWNVIMISVYFAMAVISSVIGLVYGAEFAKRENSQQQPSSGWFSQEGAFWSDHVLRLSLFMQILFEVAGGSAFFVTIVAFSFLNPEFVFWNVSAHFVTSMTFLIELSQNSMIIRWQHVLLNMLWALIYCTYIWPAVATHKVTDWPYDFLDVSNAGCFAWYFALFFANVLFYSLWYTLSRIKYEYVYKDSALVAAVLPLHFRGTGRAAAGSGGSSAADLESHHEIAGQHSPVHRSQQTIDSSTMGHVEMWLPAIRSIGMWNKKYQQMPSDSQHNYWYINNRRERSCVNFEVLLNSRQDTFRADSF